MHLYLSSVFGSRVLLAVAWVSIASSGHCQTGNTVFAAGYSIPLAPAVAPGEVVSFFVQGIGAHLTARVDASGLPLPTVLAGISATLTGDSSSTSVPASIIWVLPVNTCLIPTNLGTSMCGKYTEVRVQLPLTLPRLAPDNSTTRLVISENSVPGGSFDLGVAPDAIHVISITHADGTPVDIQSPARSGEALVMWAYGLGRTTPAVPSGQAAPTPAAITQSAFRLNFDYRPNSPPYGTLIVPSACTTTSQCPQIQPAFSGLTPGYPGLYQVNFTVPDLPSGTPACSFNSAFPYYPYKVFSNLTVSLIGSGSFDGAGICVGSD